jgi:hypothetical protein
MVEPHPGVTGCSNWMIDLSENPKATETVSDEAATAAAEIIY